MAAFVAMLFLNLIVTSVGSVSFLSGFVVGTLTFIGFGATQTFVYTTSEGPSERVWFLFGAYQIIVFAMMGGVFSIWA